MKWGVRRNRSGTINKSYQKLKRLDSDIHKRSVKAAKVAEKASTGASAKYKSLQVKADRAQYEADKKKYGLFVNQKKAAKLQVKADRAQYKANKYKARAEKRANVAASTAAAEKKARIKAEKWARQMNRTIGSMRLSELSPEQIQLGRRYLGM